MVSSVAASTPETQIPFYRVVRRLKSARFTSSHTLNENELTDLTDKNQKANMTQLSSKSSVNEEKTQIPPADKGFKAWRFAFIAFLVDAVVWGPPLCFGIFLPYKPYSELDSSMAALIGTIALGLLYCCGVIISPLAQKYPLFCAWCPSIGTLICALGLFVASYFTQGWTIVLFQGAFYGLGGCKKYAHLNDSFNTPALIHLSEWFCKKIGLAGGIMFSGSASLGLLFAPIMEWALNRYGARATLRGFAIGWLCCMIPILPFITGRLPGGKGAVGGHMDPAFLKSKLFWFLIIISCLQSIAFYVPSLYMPLYATWIGHSGSLALELYSASCVISQIVGGMASDYIDMSYLLGAIGLLSALSVFLLWGLCNGYAMFCAFSFIYGLFSPVFGCLWQRFAILIAPSDPKAVGIVNIFFATRGLVNFATGPLCGLLLERAHSTEEGFRSLIIFSGSSLLASSLGIGMKFISPRPENPRSESELA